MLRQNSQRRMKRSSDEKALLIETINKVDFLKSTANKVGEALGTLLLGTTRIAHEASKSRKEVDNISIKSFGFELDDEVDNMIESLSEISAVSRVAYQLTQKVENAVEELYDAIKKAEEIGQNIQNKM